MPKRKREVLGLGSGSLWISDSGPAPERTCICVYVGIGGGEMVVRRASWNSSSSLYYPQPVWCLWDPGQGQREVLLSLCALARLIVHSSAMNSWAADRELFHTQLPLLSSGCPPMPILYPPPNICKLLSPPQLSVWSVHNHRHWPLIVDFIKELELGSKTLEV